MSKISNELMEKTLVEGDLSKLTAGERLSYLNHICESLGLNPLTRPFEYIELPAPGGGKKLTLYARKDCTEQLRKLNGISICRLDKEKVDDLYIITAYGRTADGREDCATAAVHLVKEDGTWETSNNGRRYFKGNGKFIPLTGDALANAIMKCETKAKRRLTLSIAGLGFTDESELDTIPGAKIISSEISEPKKLEQKPIVEIDEDFLERYIGPIANATTLNELKMAYNLAADEFKDKPDVIKKLNVITNKKKGELEFIEQLDGDDDELTKAMEKKDES